MDPKRLFTFFRPLQSNKAAPANPRLLPSLLGKTFQVSPPAPVSSSTAYDSSDAGSDVDDFDFSPSDLKAKPYTLSTLESDNDFAFIKSSFTVN